MSKNVGQVFGTALLGVVGTAVGRPNPRPNVISKPSVLTARVAGASAYRGTTLNLSRKWTWT